MFCIETIYLSNCAIGRIVELRADGTCKSQSGSTNKQLDLEASNDLAEFVERRLRALGEAASIGQPGARIWAFAKSVQP